MLKILNVIVIFILTIVDSNLIICKSFNQNMNKAILFIISVYILILFIFHIFNGENFFKNFFKNKYILLFIIICFISIIYSVNPKTSFYSASKLFILYLFILYLNSKYDFKEILNIISIITSAYAIISLILIILLPNYGISYDFRYGLVYNGIFNSNNSLGLYMNLGFICSYYELIINNQKKFKPFWLNVMIICIALTILSKSSTALVTLLFVIASIIIIKLTKRYYIGYFFIFINIIYCVYICSLKNSFILYIIINILHKDLTLSGRKLIYDFVFESIKDKPLFGYGFNAFWTNNLYSVDVRSSTFQLLSSSHNSYFEILLSVGLIGLIIFIIPILIHIFTIQKIKIDEYSVHFFEVLFFIVVTIESLTERIIYGSCSLIMLILIIIMTNNYLCKNMKI